MEDTSNLLKALKIKPRKICYYAASNWKWDVYLKVLGRAEEGKFDRGALIRELISDPSLEFKSREIASFVGKVADQASRIPANARRLKLQLGRIDELDVLTAAQKFYSKQFDAEVAVFAEENPHRYDPKRRSELAQPYRPAIFIEA